MQPLKVLYEQVVPNGTFQLPPMQPVQPVSVPCGQVGEEDHLRIMCMKTGTVLNDVFDRLKAALDVVSGLEGAMRLDLSGPLLESLTGKR
jgi:hypothetical protein